MRERVHWALVMLTLSSCARDVRPAAAKAVPGFWDECSRDEDCRTGQKCLGFPEGKNLNALFCQIPCEALDGGLDQSQCPKELKCHPGQHGSSLPKCEPWEVVPNRPLILLGPNGQPIDAGASQPN